MKKIQKNNSIINNYKEYSLIEIKLIKLNKVNIINIRDNKINYVTIII